MSDAGILLMNDHGVITDDAQRRRIYDTVSAAGKAGGSGSITLGKPENPLQARLRICPPDDGDAS